MGKTAFGRRQLKFYFKRIEIELLERVCAHFRFETKAIVTKTALRLIFQAMTDTDAIIGDVLTIRNERTGKSFTFELKDPSPPKQGG